MHCRLMAAANLEKMDSELADQTRFVWQAADLQSTSGSYVHSMQQHAFFEPNEKACLII